MKNHFVPTRNKAEGSGKTRVGFLLHNGRCDGSPRKTTAPRELATPPQRKDQRNTVTFRSLWVLWSLILLQVLSTPNIVQASSVACARTSECVVHLYDGSECEDGFCTNPMYNQGCLKRMVPDWKKIRTCSSEDPPEAVELGHCKPSRWGYQEVRIFGQNWESAFFSTWILQIILSEVLDVPVTVEIGSPGQSVDFYDKHSSFDYGTSYDWTSFERAVAVEGDCVNHQYDAEGNYVPCAHIMSEVWWNSIVVQTKELQRRGILEPANDLGALGDSGTYVPRFTATRDPSLLSYLGLQGNKNRRKLAERFLRPTTWQDYCQQVSQDVECGDSVAGRAPIDDGEASSYFVAGLYKGHFRATADNDCDVNPETCRGILIDWPCDWESFGKQQIYHLDIALEVVPFAYEEILQILQAASATESDIILKWWTPTAEYEQFYGTPMEFTKVGFPLPSQQCFDARIDIRDRCSGDLEKEVGEAAGACSEQTEVLKKAIGTPLYDITHDPDIPEALWSPAYDTIVDFRISHLQLAEIFQRWLGRGVDQYGYDPREAACTWVVDNFDIIESFVPTSFPRTFIEQSSNGNSILSTAVAVAFFALVVLTVSGFVAYRKRLKSTLYHAQIEFIILLVAGWLLISSGAFLRALGTTDFTCGGSAWLKCTGYTSIFVLLSVKLDAINALASSGKRMKRLHMKKSKFIPVIVTVMLTLLGLLVWTAMDPTKKQTSFHLTNDINEEGGTVVVMTSFCASNSRYWLFGGLAWQAFWLLCASVLGSIACRENDDLNGARNLALVVASHLMFLIIRFSIVLMGDQNTSMSAAFDSIASSLDCLTAVGVYVVPKLFDKGANHRTDEPLPDLFLNTTILMADISGFTQWSSMRDPSSVFKFLESVFGEFDQIGEKLGVFTVETVGDCYVAATGLPKPKHDHAVVMAKFAAECMRRFNELTKEWEVTFGPDTADLRLRIGLHSGSVTGGFLKSKGARFQLFGDVVNTSSRMESTGQPGRIQLSEETTSLLQTAGKHNWVEKRDDKVHVKGKGYLQTYWLRLGLGKASGQAEVQKTRVDMLQSAHESEKEARKRRLVEWNVQVLHTVLKDIRLHGLATENSGTYGSFEIARMIETNDRIPLHDIKEIITLPEFNRKTATKRKVIQQTEVPPVVLEQLIAFVGWVADMYNSANAFHSFDHASHVVQSTAKYLNRIVAPTEHDLECNDDVDLKATANAALLHDHTYGITSDPLTQFACLFSALIHDVDHPGVPNTQLIKENEGLAKHYENRSVAEQKSFDLTWNKLMEEQYSDLLKAICINSTGLARFRQLVINSIMATDIADKKLKELRNLRWDKAFKTDLSAQTDEETKTAASYEDEFSLTAVNRKATIVIEHLIQASDIAHTMQHWHVYQRWNENLFREMYHAYKSGRADTDPATSWYEGEIGFFDFYVIPLAKKLRNCGVFGVSSSENLSYAKSNREEWVNKGRQVVAEMIEKVQQETTDNDSARSIPPPGQERFEL